MKGDSVDKVVKESSVIIIIPITKLRTCYISLQILSSKIHFQFVFTATRRCVNSVRLHGVVYKVNLMCPDNFQVLVTFVTTATSTILQYSTIQE